MDRAVLDVGQCGFDGPRLEHMLSRGLHCEVESAATAEEAIEKMQSRDYDLCLVNRQLTSDGSCGIELIAAAREAGVHTPLMLVSDRADAQEQAVALGALPGFGKSELDEAHTVDLLRQAMA